jgi:hypothetical protein
MTEQNKKEEVWFGQKFVTISKVSPNICEKSSQKFVTISVPQVNIAELLPNICDNHLAFCC